MSSGTPSSPGSSPNAPAGSGQTQSPSVPASSGQQSQSSTSGIQTSSPTGVVPPQQTITSNFVTGDPLNTVQYINDPAWPPDLRLDRANSNWKPWSHRLKIICDRQGFTDWLDESFPVPNPTTEPHASRVWTINDCSLKAFILGNISEEDYKAVHELPSSRAVFAELRTRHEKLGGHTQILLIQRAMNICFQPGTSLTKTLNDINAISNTIKAIGPFGHDQLQTAFVIHALGDFYENLQSTVQAITKIPNFMHNDVVQCIHEEEDLIRNHEGQAELPSATALVSQPGARSRLYCSHCKRLGHLTDFCIRPGGKMEGHTIEEARAAQRAASQRSSCTGNSSHSQTASANIAIAEVTSTATDSIQTATTPSITINGITYVPASTPTITRTSTPTGSSALCAYEDDGQPILDKDYYYDTFLADCGELYASVDWENQSEFENLIECNPQPVAYSASGSLLPFTQSPFFLDTGATTHITPERSDFESLHPIAPYPILGVGGSCIYAVGKGTVKIRIPDGGQLTLENVLFVPKSKVRLISIVRLNRSGQYTSHFNSNSFWLTDKDDTIVLLRGTIIENRLLYGLNLHNTCDSNTKPHGSKTSLMEPTQSAFYASRTPDVETWHQRLGHCNVSTIVNMAQKGTVKGMAIDLSSSPAKCNACILGKQTQTPVPKVREGERANHPFEQVFVDLCGPIWPVSSSSNLYSMNVIDDFSNYVWSLPLHSKGDAATELQKWHCTIENQTGHKLKILVTDNGELVSKSMADWCSQLGIIHL